MDATSGVDGLFMEDTTKMIRRIRLRRNGLKKTLQPSWEGTRGETRVNYKHLLEDLRDMYPFPLNETIIVELIANALDAQPEEIKLTIDQRRRALTVIDDGRGMSKQQLEQYHDLAATTKARGKGIGFAGVGAKLSLLLGKVVTETRTKGFHAATEWYLQNDFHAPWLGTSPKGKVSTNMGSAVMIVLEDTGSPLLDADSVADVIRRHYYPLLDDEFWPMLWGVYPKRVSLYVNGSILHTASTADEKRKCFSVIQKRRQVGHGFIMKTSHELDEAQRGIAVSTYGKVIKRGWEWLGISPRNPAHLAGLVEIPALSSILATNKADFLKDGTSLKKYYSCREAIQEALDPILRSLGEITSSAEYTERELLYPIEKEVQQVLEDMLADFPELSPLVGRKGRGEPVEGVIPDEESPLIGRLAEGSSSMTGTMGGAGEGSGLEVAPGPDPDMRIEPSSEADQRGEAHEGRKKRPTLMISYENDPTSPELGRLWENTVWINTSHPAYGRTRQNASEKYYVHVAVAWVLSKHLGEGKSALEFMNKYLILWGKAR